MRYAVLGSGSCGNSYIFKTASSSFVVDNGYSFAEFRRRAEAFGFDISAIKYIFLTHIHSDHLKGVETLSNRLGIPVITAEDLDVSGYIKKGFFKQVGITPGQAYNLDDFSFTVFPTFHDAPNSVGYSFFYDGNRCTIITDTGKTSPQMKELADKSDVLFLESNYCPDLLKKGPYPVWLQKRILSEYGHLSNFDALEFLKSLDCTRCRKVYLCHISDKNNTPQRVQEVFDSAPIKNIEYIICKRGIPVMGEE
ncbi:MAG: MBL fold metallo-hydrolase [Spirochaetia bacterium]|nr:MBL fold metallo-hydrolase [Spirochaetia bacterium]